ncbi:MAG: hypothetical protein ACI9UU_000058 [Candidatus Azotimanducaceae bacterium]|jgi:hypothetical protein
MDDCHDAASALVGQEVEYVHALVRAAGLVQTKEGQISESHFSEMMWLGFSRRPINHQQSTRAVLFEKTLKVKLWWSLS